MIHKTKKTIAMELKDFELPLEGIINRQILVPTTKSITSKKVKNQQITTTEINVGKSRKKA